jgi:predicted nucleic acid-binding protein
MILVLDTSAGVAISLRRSDSMPFHDIITRADYVIAPDIYIAEVTNVFWKYHQYHHLDRDICNVSIDLAKQLVDSFIDSEILYKEAFSFSCQNNHPVYDSLFLILARRENAKLLTLDKKMKTIASRHSIQIA